MTQKDFERLMKQVIKEEMELMLTGCVLIERIMVGNVKSETHENLLVEVQERLS